MVTFRTESRRTIDMKKFVLAFTALFLSFNVFSYEGVMTGQKNLRIIKTQHFDVIYASASSESAGILVQKADSVYDELAEKFSIKKHFRMPVVVVDGTDSFNAYFSSFPFNHIVMFDSIPDAGMAVFEETFINTFRHELIHGITYNCRNNFWFGLDGALGDVYNPALLTITTAWAEGAAVSLESEFGQGRMNSDYALQMLRQAKIDGCFPKYSDIQGARDIYPSTTMSYIFGGAFCRWLQQKYGMEKYADFWYRSVNFKVLTYFGCFKKVYGKSIRTAWKEFYDSIEIPEGVQIKKVGGRKLSYYKSLTVCTTGYAYIDLFKTAVYFAENGKKPRLLFTQDSLDKVNLSCDGAYLAVTYTDNSYANGRSRVYVFDMKKKRSFYIEGTGLKEAEVFKSGGEYYLAAQRRESEFAALVIYRLNRKKSGRIYEAELAAEFPQEYGKQIFALEGTDSGNLYFIRKDGLDFSICRYEPESGEFTAFELPIESMVVQGLNYNGGKLYFSYTLKGTLPRLGILVESQEGFTAELSEIDVPGGMLCPIPGLPEDEEIVCIANHLSGTEIKRTALSALDFMAVSLTPQELGKGLMAEGQMKPAEDATSGEQDGTLEELEGSRKFSALAYTFKGPRGAFLPFSLAKTYSIYDTGDILKSVMIPFGVTYMSSTPWTYPIYYLSAGYGPLTNSYALQVGIYRGGTTNSLFNYSGDAKVEFDSDGYKQTSCNVQLTSEIPLVRTLTFLVAENFQFMHGRQSNWEYSLNDLFPLSDCIGLLNHEDKVDLSVKRLFISNTVSAGISNIHKAGRGYFNYAGFRLLPSVSMTACAKASDLDKQYYRFDNLSVDLMFKIPGIIPLTLEAALFPANQYVGYGVARANLFTWEIQKSTEFLPLLYFNRLSFSAQYTAKIKEHFNMASWPISRAYDYFSDVKDGITNYYDELSLMATAYFTPNIGGLARTDFQVKASGGFIYRFCPESDEKTAGLALSVTIGSFTFQ